ncbi:cytochrome c oxidase subunit 6b-1-like isoform X2 [Dioscorea cayenensis subsp. rotundata]|uniref:Cytochrome c oxidase subunit 6b-1-like isoform X2 n=1 Tax=Dioscorea cayennensis subsp. rotundata TaxID=55577 RepID=A0AB40BHJ3_DIOCR|nr:cytochrome c oxidase subunit 6b-1-like isoform X2 [Dioscorea cayenensis subsp. rotundata]
MAESVPEKVPSLAEDKEVQPDQSDKPVETTVDEKPDDTKTEEVAKETTEVTSAPVENAPVAEEPTEPVPEAPTSEEPTDTSEKETEDQGNAEEETPAIKLETAPADFRFPTTNQTRHCFTRYIEYHRCVAAKGDDAQECEKFAKYYRSLCPSEWIERWNEQRENGTFPGPL